MVGVVDAAVAVEDDLRVRGEHRVRPERPDLANELLAQRQVVVERAVGLMQERHARIADDVGGDALLLFAQGGQLERVAIRILAARVAARAAHEPADGSRVDPARSRRGGPKSASSGWATMTMNRAGRHVVGRSRSPERSLRMRQ